MRHPQSEQSVPKAQRASVPDRPSSHFPLRAFPFSTAWRGCRQSSVHMYSHTGSVCATGGGGGAAAFVGHPQSVQSEPAVHPESQAPFCARSLSPNIEWTGGKVNSTSAHESKHLPEQDDTLGGDDGKEGCPSESEANPVGHCINGSSSVGPS